MATMVRWTPFRELDSMERRMRRMLENVGFAPALLPAVDVYETDGEFVIELEAPGFAEQELGVEVFDHTLRIVGERKETTSEQKKAFRLQERLEREFERRFELPAEADTKHVTAKFAGGVLEVRTPKLETTTPTKVQIASK